MPGENNGYSQGLFNPQGPRDFATAIGDIGKNLGEAAQAFTSFGSSAEDALRKIETRLGNLTDQAGNLQGALGGGGRGDGGAGADWSYDPNAKDGGVGGRRGQNGLGGNWRLPNQNARMTGAQTYMQAGTAIAAAGIGIAQGYVQGQLPSMYQMAAVTQGFANQFGTYMRPVVPPQVADQYGGGRFMVTSPADYAQSLAMTSRLATPNTPAFSAIMGQANTLAKLVPGTTQTQQLGAFATFNNPQTLNFAYSRGYNLRPGGNMLAPNQLYAQFGQMLTLGRGLEGATPDELRRRFQPGQEYYTSMIAAGVDPESEQGQAFINYMMTQSAFRQKTGRPFTGDMFTKQGQAQLRAAGINLDTSTAKMLQAQGAKASAESQLYPGMLKASNTFNDAVNKFATAVSNMLGGTRGNSLGQSLGWATGMAGQIPGLGAIANLGGVAFPSAGGAPSNGGITASGSPAGAAPAGPGGGPGGGGISPLSIAEGIGLAKGGSALWALAAANPEISVPVGVAAATYVAGSAIDRIPAVHRALSGSKDKHGGSLWSDFMKWNQSKKVWGNVWHWLNRKPPGAQEGGVVHGPTNINVGEAGPEQITPLARSSVGQSRGDQADLGKSFNDVGDRIINAIYQLGINLRPGGQGAASTAGWGTSQATGLGTFQNWYGPGTTGTPGANISGKSLTSLFHGGGNGGSGGNTTSNGGVGATAGGGGPISGGDLSDPHAWAVAFLTGLGAPQTPENINSLLSWQQKESGGDLNTGKPDDPIKTHNPLNTTLNAFGGTKLPTSSAGVRAYPDWQSGLKANLQVIQNGLYPDLVAALMAGTGLQKGNFPGLQKWGTGGTHLARGSYNIDRTQLALLHTGERVIPAAENYSTTGRYQRGGAGPTQAAPTVHLNFSASAIQLTVPPASTAQDMERIAKQFVAAISKPQVLASVRST